MNEAIIRALNENEITYMDIVASIDKGELLTTVDIINTPMKNYNLLFSIEKLLFKEFLVLCSASNYKIVITPYYLECLTVL